MSRRGGGVIAALTAGLALTGCLGSSGDRSPREDRLAELGLAGHPPANVIEECKEVARQTNLTVYCPPVVPKGPVDIDFGGLFGRGADDTYAFSFRSESLARSERTFERHPEDGHWAVAAVRPAQGVGDSVDHSESYLGQRRRFITVNGVRAAVLTGKTTGAGLLSSDHVIVYWRMGDTGYLASVHDRFPRSRGRTSDQSERYAPVTEEIARELINQMLDCPPRGTDRESQSCDWVFASG